MPLTLLSHFWNEALLLPYWLRHHYPLFDHGVLVDYGSTDGSVDIIRTLAPGWEVRTSRNAWFAAADVDAEIMELERAHPGWKMVLNTTEFLLCADVRQLIHDLETAAPPVPGLWGFDLALVDPPAAQALPLTDAPLYCQRRWGYHTGGERSRLLHNAPDGRYNPGRHSSGVANKHPDARFYLLWCGWSPYPQVRARKLQIQTRVPGTDRAQGRSWQHFVTPAELEQRYHSEAAKACDLWERYPAYSALVRQLGHQAGLKELPAETNTGCTAASELRLDDSEDNMA